MGGRDEGSAPQTVPSGTTTSLFVELAEQESEFVRARLSGKQPEPYIGGPEASSDVTDDRDVAVRNVQDEVGIGVSRAERVQDGPCARRPARVARRYLVRSGGVIRRSCHSRSGSSTPVLHQRRQAAVARTRPGERG